MVNHRQRFALVTVFLLLVTILALAFPRLTSAFFSNLGSIELGKAIIRGDVQGLEKARTLFERALQWDRGNERANTYMHDYLERENRIKVYRRMLKAGATFETVYRSLAKELVDLYNEKLTLDPANARYHFLLGKYQQELGNGEEARANFLYVVENASSPTIGLLEVGEAYYRLGEYFEAKGEPQKAIENYEMALWSNKQLIEAYQHLLPLYARGDLQEKLSRMKAQLATLQPKYRVQAQVAQDWFLEGYDLDEVALEMDTRIRVYFYWKPSPDISIDGLGLFRVGQWWVQVRDTLNLVTNGSFEEGLDSKTVLPYGFSHVYTQRRQEYKLALDYRDGKNTTVAIVENPVTDGAGLSAWNIPVQSGATYLQGGWMRTDPKVGASMGHLWVGNVTLDPPYRFFVGYSPQDWRFHAGVVTPPPGAREIQLWLLNYQTVGKAIFDDILFMKLETPTKTVGSGQKD